MRDLRRLPPVLRVASLLRPLFPLGYAVMFAVPLTTRQWTTSWSALYLWRAAIIAGDLGLVGLACILTVRAYTSRSRQQDGGPLALDTWQRQVRAILVPSALPICAIVLALVISPTARAFEIVFPVSIIGAGVFFATALPMVLSRSAMITRDPPPTPA